MGDRWWQTLWLRDRQTQQPWLSQAMLKIQSLTSGGRCVAYGANQLGQWHIAI